MQVGLKDERRGSQPLQRVYFIEAKPGFVFNNTRGYRAFRTKEKEARRPPQCTYNSISKILQNNRLL